jgi:putative redox protein
MRSHTLRFPNAAGALLSGRVDRPVDTDPAAWALFAHCFTCSKSLRAIGIIAEALTAGGLGVVRFDFTGLGASEGDFADTTFSSNVDDLGAAIEAMAQDPAIGAPALLIGHSLGGAAVLQAAARAPAVRALVTIGAPSDPVHVTHLLAPARDQIEREGEATVELAGRQFRIKRQFLLDLEAGAMRARIGDLRRPLLVMHGPLDDTVGIDNAAAIFAAAKHPKSFLSLDDADHLLRRPEDARYVGDVIAAWASRYVGTARAPETP